MKIYQIILAILALLVFNLSIDKLSSLVILENTIEFINWLHFYTLLLNKCLFIIAVPFVYTYFISLIANKSYEYILEHSDSIALFRVVFVCIAIGYALFEIFK